MSKQLLILSFLALFCSAIALQCGSNECPDGNQCCDDEVMGNTCYSPQTHNCTADPDGTYRLCGNTNGACNTVCYEKFGYFCCGNSVMQMGQSCDVPTPTSSPTSPTPTPTPVSYNCPSAGGASAPGGLNCNSNELCCGDFTMTPSCMPKNGDKQCCEWYLSARQCNKTEVCGGDLGYGASSYAECGPPGTVFCNKGDAINTFCQPNETCCGNYGSFAFCCPSGTSCNNTHYTCDPPQVVFDDNTCKNGWTPLVSRTTFLIQSDRVENGTNSTNAIEYKPANNSYMAFYKKGALDTSIRTYIQLSVSAGTFFGISIDFHLFNYNATSKKLTVLQANPSFTLQSTLPSGTIKPNQFQIGKCTILQHYPAGIYDGFMLSTNTTQHNIFIDNIYVL